MAIVFYLQNFAKLVYKAKQGKLTEDEQAVLEEWMAEGEGRRRLVERICGEEYWEGQWAEHHAYDVERGWRRFRREVRALEARRRLVRWGSVAAGIAVVAGAVLFVVERKGTAPAVMPVVEAVEPGRSVAVLTLADGSRMVLGDTLRASLQESGAEIRIEGDRLGYAGADIRIEGDRLGYAGADSLAAGAYNRVATPRGGEFRITLADGTQVWLNAESELSYPVAFAGGRREVELRGEAYFEVARDAARPFIVKTAAMDVRVLGTSFNVCAYPEEQAQATLVEGSVAVDDGREERVLEPGEQLSRDVDGTVAVRKVDTEAYGEWRNRQFVFEDDLLGTVLGKLERWYDVEFFIQHSSLEELRFTGNLPKYENLEEVLRKLEQTTYIHFERNGRAVVVSEER